MTIESWGVGRPDFNKEVLASRPTVLSNQQMSWSYSNTFVVGAQDVSSIDIYTVPSNYSLELTGGQISSKESVINKLKLSTNTQDIISDFRYDTHGDILLKGQTVGAGEVITAYIYNNEVVSANISLILLGVLTVV
jgi:hypothetical protein